jgi:putative ABC transport system substrate-binding protein
VNRRDFCIRLGSVCAALTAGDSRSDDRIPVVAVLRASSFSPNDPVTRLINDSLRALGYTPDKDLRIEQFSARNQAERVPILAEEAVKRKVDVIIATTASAAQAAKKATNTIPIVFVANDQDPVAAGLVDSLARPGGNLTGIFSLQPQLVGKRFELLHEILPDLSTVAVLKDEALERMPEGLEAAASATRVKLKHVSARWPEDFPRAFRTARDAEAVMVLYSPMFQTNRAQLAQAALKAGMPTICQERSFVEAGALMSYAADRKAVAERVAYLIDRILKGTRPADLPVEQAAKFELVINRKTARTLEIAIPRSVLVRADGVIE